MQVVGKARLPVADLSRHVQVDLPGPRAEALLFVHRARFAARATPIVARNYAFLAACFEAYEMCILFASLHSQQFRTCSSKMRADIFAHIYESVSNITKYVSSLEYRAVCCISLRNFE